MPEGPELRHSRDILREIARGKNVIDLHAASTGRYKSKDPEGLDSIKQDLPLEVVDIDVKGKFMWWTFKSATRHWRMWVTYGMSGQWATEEDTHTAFVVDLGDKKLFFIDPRHFGTIKFTNDESAHSKKLSTLGPDMLDDTPVTPELFAEKILLKPNKTIAEILMDQSCVSGVGNYIKSECLYRSGISPHRKAIDLESQEILKLWSETISTCRESYVDHGATLRTYKNVDGSSGDAQFRFRIYSKKSCELGHPSIREETLDGRTSWWCSVCQK